MAHFNLGRITAPKTRPNRSKSARNVEPDAPFQLGSIRISDSPILLPLSTTTTNSNSSKSQHNSPKTGGGLSSSSSSKNKSTRSKKAMTVHYVPSPTPDGDDMPSLQLNKHKLHRHSSELHHTDFKSKYEKKAAQNRELNRTVQEQEASILQLKRELRKHTKSDAFEYDQPSAEKQFARALKHKDQEIANMRRRLKLAINDYEKVFQYYKKQLDQFKRNQQRWLDEQKRNQKDVTKYVFVDDIQKIKIRKKGVRIFFVDGDDVVFEHISVEHGNDYNDDDQYRTLVAKIQQEEPHARASASSILDANTSANTAAAALDDDDLIILCLDELAARTQDFRRYGRVANYSQTVRERHEQLPAYHIDHDYLVKLKNNNREWLQVFGGGNGDGGGCGTPVVNGKRKGKLGAFFAAQRELKQGKQPTICVQNSVVLGNLRERMAQSESSKKPQKALNAAQRAQFAQRLQSRLNEQRLQVREMDPESKEDSSDTDTEDDDDDDGGGDEQQHAAGLLSNVWFNAQVEMQRDGHQPAVCVRNGIRLARIQRAPNKYKIKRKLKAATIQKRLDLARTSTKKRSGGGGAKKLFGHSRHITMDKGDSSEEDDDGNDIYYRLAEQQQQQSVPLRVTKFGPLLNGWFSAQMDLGEAKQPAVCVQHNVFLENVENNNSLNTKQPQKKPKLDAKTLQKRLNANTSNGLPKNAVDMSDDEDDEQASDDDDGSMHEHMWYYKNQDRSTFIKSLKIDADKTRLLRQIAVFLNRLLPTSIDFGLVKQYLPVFTNVYDIIAACFDGVLLSALLNFIDDDLIDLRALHLAKTKYPIDREQVVENMFVVKLCISSLDLHEFPHFGVDFDAMNDDKDLFCWYNARHTVDILLLILMHAFMGMMNRKINIYKFPELFRLLLLEEDKESAAKFSCKEWLNRWIVYMKSGKKKKKNLQSISNSKSSKLQPIKNKSPVVSLSKNHNVFASIDLGGYHSPGASVNISWEHIKIVPDEHHHHNDDDDDDADDDDADDDDDDDFKYVWNTTRDYSSDLSLIEERLRVSVDRSSSRTYVQTIAMKSDIYDDGHKNYLLQVTYLSDLFCQASEIEKLSGSEHQQVLDYLKRRPRDDQSIIAWINSFKFMDDEQEEFQYVDNLFSDISDGVILLRILDRIKPGCVDWKTRGIRVSKDVRHKFDRLANCNAFKQICDAEFGDVFHFVSIAGNDIVDGTNDGKYVRSILLQIQRFHSTELMAKILFKKRNVTDDELLLWMNSRLRVYQQMVSALSKMHNNDVVLAGNNIKQKQQVNIASFDDKKALSDCLNFCNVVSSVNPRWIDYACVHDEKDCEMDANNKLLNAKYLITIMRRLGCDNIFSTPRELVECQNRAALSMATAIMTIAARYNQYDQLRLFAKNLEQIKSRMASKK